MNLLVSSAMISTTEPSKKAAALKSIWTEILFGPVNKSNQLEIKLALFFLPFFSLSFFPADSFYIWSSSSLKWRVKDKWQKNQMNF